MCLCVCMCLVHVCFDRCHVPFRASLFPLPPLQHLVLVKVSITVHDVLVVCQSSSPHHTITILIHLMRLQFFGLHGCHLQSSSPPSHVSSVALSLKGVVILSSVLLSLDVLFCCCAVCCCFHVLSNNNNNNNNSNN